MHGPDNEKRSEKAENRLFAAAMLFTLAAAVLGLVLAR